MKLKLLTFVFSLTTLFASCQTNANNTLNEFKRVDSSLQTTNSSLVDNTFSILYGQVQAKKEQYPKVALQADTLFKATEDAFDFIEGLKQKLNDLDPSGTQLDIGAKLLVNTANAMALTNKLNAVYVSCTAALVDKQNKIQAQNIFSIAREMKTNKNWTSTYFDDTPTVGVITILDKFKNECSNLAIFSLTEIKNTLSN